MGNCIKTKFLILSDTHSCGPQKLNVPDVLVDVAIHCGDLTQGSTLHEFRVSLDLLRQIKATLKLVIAGNHDFTLDAKTFARKVKEARGPFKVPPGVVDKIYGPPGAARSLIDSDSDNIIFLDEGTHRFNLKNGASLTVYASPFTPSRDLEKGSTYMRSTGHKFAIPEGMDIVITHGPPKGVLDMDRTGKRAGCDDLLAAVAKARPRMHCFGHIHEAWGARLIVWPKSTSESLSHVTDITSQRYVLVNNLTTLHPRPGGLRKTDVQKASRLQEAREVGYIKTSHCGSSRDAHPIEPGRKTLFVNAAIIPNPRTKEKQLPWIVEIDLPASKEADSRKDSIGGNLPCPFPCQDPSLSIESLTEMTTRLSIESAA
ncbi:Metallo-dependent phosphatase-like protein [Apiosordaria backusii]|uniref:Metallo-dependent phosphatase-like protein n=1 Tax=Apiosordaria backusii TaxID=314023 RepID=A0AA39ZSN2_9PEZI|nr:Metallo-dependent phosphatase-like protein [Apiosordaria backusii]